MQYDTQREPVILKEYGRNIQNLINHLKTITDKKQRNELASQLVHIMRLINPVRDSAENQQRAWDQLFMMAGYDIDIDSPFEVPKPEELAQKPKPLPYPHGSPKYKHFGRNLERMIASTCKISDESLRKDTTLYIAKTMKTFYSSWIKDLSSSAIADTIFDLSKGTLDIRAEVSENPNLLGSASFGVPYPATESENRNRRKKRRKNKNKQNNSPR